jgi:membrane protease YdiL (CAAX protease family)
LQTNMNGKTADLSPANKPELSSAEQSPSPQPSILRKVFFGAEGLRAGWSLLLFVALMAAFFKGIATAGHLLHLTTERGPSDTGASLKFLFVVEFPPLLATFVVTWIMSKIERRSNSVYGLGGSHKLSRFFSGLAWGVTCLSLLFLTLWKTGLLIVDSRLVFGSDVFRYGATWLAGFLMVGMFEEYLTRGYLQFTLSRGLAGIYRWVFKTRHSATLGFWTSALLLSFLFGLGHNKNPGESPIGLLSAGLAAMVFCFALWRTGSLWWAIGFHASWDWAQSFLYGVADSGLFVQHRLLATHPAGRPILSGGATGPEGSIFVVPILILIAVIILTTLRGTHAGYTFRDVERVEA